MGVANSFAPIAAGTNKFSRKWAGSTRDSVDPFITGYFFIHFAYLPPKLIDNIKRGGGNDGLSTDQEVKNVLSSTCQSVTLPGATINKAEFNGLGGIKWAVPTNVEFDNTVSMRFLEYSSLPILAIMHGWVRMIRDYRSGVSTLDSGGSKSGDAKYTKSEYASTAYFWTTKPDGHLVEYAACLTGLFPMKDPTDQYGAEITTTDKLELDVDWNVDYVFREPWVYDRCQNLANTYYGAWNDGNGVIGGYGSTEPER
jgi:hypothetical protein